MNDAQPTQPSTEAAFDAADAGNPANPAHGAGDAASEAAAGAQASAVPSLPPDVLIIVPVRDTVLFPGTVFPISIGRESSILAAQQALREERPIGILMQRESDVAQPGPIDMHRTGTTANILRYVNVPDGGHHIVVQGLQRFRIVEFVRERPFLAARVVPIEEPEDQGPEIEARLMHLKQQAMEALQLLPQVPQELIAAVQSARSPGPLADLVAAYLDVSRDDKQELLETIDLRTRVDKVSGFLAKRIEVMRLTQEIGQRTKASFDERQREAILREQMAAIQRELGEGDGRSQEVADLSKAIDEAKMPEEVEENARKELRRYERMPEAAPEAGMVRNYLDWLIELPWAEPEQRTIDIAEARRVLDEDHFGLDKIKKRIVEFLAVR
ncbi:MAG TPA: LON peptidase substrate-binding domain-containing protein, partial [Zeimonas sp.]